MKKGLILTLRSLGFDLTFKEILRRLFSISYTYNGVRINSDELFRLVRNMALRNFQVYGLNNEIIVLTYFGKIAVDITDYDLLWILLEPLEKHYGCIDVNDAIVIDIGAFIGETSLFFLSKGAKKVYAFEPVEKFYRYLKRNVLRNGFGGKVILNNFGIWFHDGILQVSLKHMGTGLEVDGNDFIRLRVKSLDKVLRFIYNREGRINIVKMDCEGCEFSVLNTDNETLRLPEHYIIEIHGSETPIIYKMSHIGYERKLIVKYSRYHKIYLFSRF